MVNLILRKEHLIIVLVTHMGTVGNLRHLLPEIRILGWQPRERNGGLEESVVRDGLSSGIVVCPFHRRRSNGVNRKHAIFSNFIRRLRRPNFGFEFHRQNARVGR